MTEALGTGESDSERSFRRPLATVTVQDEEGAHELVVAKDGDNYFARRQRSRGCLRSQFDAVPRALTSQVDDFRNKRLFDFGFEDPARIAVRDGDRTVTVARKEDKWLLESHGNREVEGERVQTLLDKLRALTATGFPSNRAADQAQYGLARAAVEATVTPQEEGASVER